MTENQLFSAICEHLLQDKTPSRYLEQVFSHPLFSEYPFDMLQKLKTTPQSPIHHPEGSVWNHTLLVVDQAAKVRDKSRDPAAFMWAALLHDIGKPATTRERKGKITSYNHDNIGAALARKFLGEFPLDAPFVKTVCNLVKYHMHPFYILHDLPFADMAAMKRETDIEEIALLSLCDRLGRANADKEKEESAVREFLQKAK